MSVIKFNCIGILCMPVQVFIEKKSRIRDVTKYTHTKRFFLKKNAWVKSHTGSLKWCSIAKGVLVDSSGNVFLLLPCIWRVQLSCLCDKAKAVAKLTLCNSLTIDLLQWIILSFLCSQAAVSYQGLADMIFFFGGGAICRNGYMQISWSWDCCRFIMQKCWA